MYLIIHLINLKMEKKRINVSLERAKAIIDNNLSCTSKELEEVISELQHASIDLPSWLVVLFKVIIYALGLLLAGVGTATAASNKPSA